jgi:hypothetical protein
VLGHLADQFGSIQFCLLACCPTLTQYKVIFPRKSSILPRATVYPFILRPVSDRRSDRLAFRAVSLTNINKAFLALRDDWCPFRALRGSSLAARSQKPGKAKVSSILASGSVGRAAASEFVVGTLWPCAARSSARALPPAGLPAATESSSDHCCDSLLSRRSHDDTAGLASSRGCQHVTGPGTMTPGDVHG